MISTSSGHSVKIAETDNDRSSHGAIVTRNYLRVLGRTVFNEKRTRPGLLLFIFGYDSFLYL